MDYGCARVSTTQQDLDRQLDALAKAGAEAKRIYSDKESGATALLLL
ncbi:MAG: recombinase family protein [Nakamurella sp.]